MATIISKQDTDGSKALLTKGEFGYDDYTAGGDTGRVYIGDGSSNLGLAKQSEIYTQTELDAGQLDNRYYTESETDTQISDRMSGFKNKIINPAFEVQQYPDIDTAPVAMVNNTYQIDRFMSSAITVTGTIQRLAKRLINGKYVNTVKCIATSTATGRLGLIQKSELFYNGEIKAFGVWVKSNSTNARALLYDGVAVYESSAHTGSGNDEFLSFSSTINISATQLWAYVQLCGAGGISTSITTGDYIESTMWQLEDGSITTKFEQRPVGLELSLCQRYYQVFDFATTNISLTRFSASAGFGKAILYYNEKMRVAPTVTDDSGWFVGTGYDSAPTYSPTDSFVAVSGSVSIAANSTNYATFASVYFDAEL